MVAASSLASSYAGWDLHQARLVRALEPLSPEQFRLRAGGDLRPIGETAAHIVGARVFWFHRIMGEGAEELDQWDGLDDLDESARPLKRVLEGIAATWGLIEEVLDHTTPANVSAVYRREAPGRVRTYTRQMLIWRILEHDIHHAGEISLTLGVHGLPGLPEEYPTLADSRDGA
jgi:uncharacterized damage-inducible protein DinB